MRVVRMRGSQGVVTRRIKVVLWVLGMRVRSYVGNVRMRGNIIPRGGSRWREMLYLVDMGRRGATSAVIGRGTGEVGLLVLRGEDVYSSLKW